MSILNEVADWFARNDIRSQQRDGINECYGYVTIYGNFTYIIQVTVERESLFVKSYLIEDPDESEWEDIRPCKTRNISQCLDESFSMIKLDAKTRAMKN
jgi:hypothetical protein